MTMATARTYTFAGYAAVIAFYACIMACALMGQCPAPAADVPEQQHPVDSTRQDIHDIIDWQPALQVAGSDTLSNRPARYHVASVTGTEQVTDVAYLLRSTLFAEFSKRFNAEPRELERLAAIDFTSGGTLDVRTGCILSLFNDAQVTSNTGILQFARDMVCDSVLIDRENGINVAAVASFEYTDTRGTLLPVRLTFRQGWEGPAPVWYMTEAESPHFTCGNPDEPYYMDFTEHELLFIGMSRHPQRSAASLAGPDFVPDPRTAFLALVSSGAITYKRSVGTAFVLWLGDYILLVEHVESWEHRRSGLLVTRMVKDGQLIFENRPL